LVSQSYGRKLNLSNGDLSAVNLRNNCSPNTLPPLTCDSEGRSGVADIVGWTGLKVQACGVFSMLLFDSSSIWWSEPKTYAYVLVKVVMHDWTCWLLAGVG